MENHTAVHPDVDGPRNLSHSSSSSIFSSSSLPDKTRRKSRSVLSVSSALSDDASLVFDSLSQEEEIPYTKWQQRRIIGIAALSFVISTSASSMYITILPSLAEQMDSTVGVLTLGVTLFQIATGVSPLFLGPASDIFGRRVALLSSIAVFIGACLACGGSLTPSMLIAFRVLQGAGASGPPVISTGIIADVFPPQDRGSAIGFVIVPSMIAGIFVPLFGGWLNDLFGWRAQFWASLVFGIFVFLVVFFGIPETNWKVKQVTNRIEKAKAANKPEKDDFERLPEPVTFLGILRPVYEPLLLFKRPTLLVTALGRISTMGAGYIVIWYSPIVLADVYDLDSAQIGFLQAAGVIGAAIGSIAGGRVTDWMRRNVNLTSTLLLANFEGVAIGFAALGFAIVIPRNIWGGLIFQFIVGFLVTAERVGVFSFLLSQVEKHQTSGAQAVIIAGQWLWVFLNLTIASIVVTRLGYPFTYITVGNLIVAALGNAIGIMYCGKWWELPEDTVVDRATQVVIVSDSHGGDVLAPKEVKAYDDLDPAELAKTERRPLLQQEEGIGWK